MKILQKFYFLTKLSTSVALLAIIIFSIYIFSKNYFEQEKITNSIVEDKIDNINTEINNKFNENKKNIDVLLKRLDQIDETIKVQIESSNPEQQIQLKKEIDLLSSDVKILLDKNDYIEKKAKVITINENININLIATYINSILVSIENNLEFSTTLEELYKIVENDSVKSNIEKLFFYSNGGILSYKDLKNSYYIYNDLYLKALLKNNSKYPSLNKFLMNLFSLRSDPITLSDNQNIKILSIATNYLENEEILKTINELKQLNYNENHFNKWIDNAKEHIEAKSILFEIQKEYKL